MLSDRLLVQNKLLSRLTTETWLSLRTRLLEETFSAREVVNVIGSTIDAVYFPQNCMFSLVARLEDGFEVEAGVIGHEGMLGLSIISGEKTAFVEGMVQMPGAAFRLGRLDFERYFHSDREFRQTILRFNEVQHCQIMQTAACNARHSVDQRLARWLLMARDRAFTDTLPISHEFLAMMLGVARPTVSIAALRLQNDGCIQYTNGRISILNRVALNAASCQCYQAVRRRSVRLMDGPGVQDQTAD